jgi:hypothetical protein
MLHWLYSLLSLWLSRFEIVVKCMVWKWMQYYPVACGLIPPELGVSYLVTSTCEPIIIYI